MKIESFDPAMCCSTGVCGPSVDPELARYAADLDWLKRQGVEVIRHNLAQSPAEFANSPAVKNALAKEGNKCLPLLLVDGKIVSTGSYPSRTTLAGFAGLQVNSDKDTAKGCCGSESKKSDSSGSCCG
jgi:hypothetical protein